MSRRMRSLLPLAAVVFVSTAPAPARWELWHNPRFGTEAEIPVDVFGGPVVADNGDGGTWNAPDGARLLVFGHWNANDRDPKSQWQAMITNNPERYRGATYRRVTGGALTVSGFEGRNVYYERYRFDDPSGAVHTMIIEYPMTARSRYDPLVAQLSRSLGWPRPLTR